MQPASQDTSPEAQRVMDELLRRASPGKKLTLTFDLIQTARLFVLAGLRRRHATESEETLRRRLIAKLLPRNEVIKAYGFDPDSEFD